MNLKRRYLICVISFIMCTVFSGVMIYGLSLMTVDVVDVNISRNLSDYISEQPPHIMPETFCLEKKLLLVIVCSRPTDFTIRQAIRETWAQKHPNVSFFFLFGKVKNDQLLQLKLEAESSKFNDMIQERFIDSYNNLTLKTVNMLKLFTLHCMTSHKYLMKIDDDVFLNVPNLLKMLQTRHRHSNVLLGRVKTNQTPYRARSSKWYMPYEWYPSDKYPDHLCGAGYIMSSDVAQKLYTCSMSTPLLHTEDVFVGMCAKKINISLENDYLFNCNPKSAVICYYENVYTLHYYTAERIRNAHEMVKSDYCKVYSKLDVMKQWIFFFDLL